MPACGATRPSFDLLARQADARPDKVFATDGQRSLSYRELHDSTLRLAAD